MSPELVGFLALLGLVAVWYLELMPPLGASLVIRIRGGALVAVRGGVRSHVLDELAEILRQERLARGLIAMNDNQRIVFFRTTIKGKQ